MFTGQLNNDNGDTFLKLAQLEATISQQLAYLAVPSESGRLKRSLDEAEKCVSRLPQEVEREASVWRQKLASWWSVFATKGTGNTAAIHKVFPTLPNWIHLNQTDPNVSNEFLRPLPSKEQLTEQLKTMFEAAKTVENGDDLAGLKALLSLVSKAEAMTFTYIADVDFQGHLLGLITPKLHPEGRLKFLYGKQGAATKDGIESPFRSAPPPKNILNLKSFLIRQIDAAEDARLIRERLAMPAPEFPQVKEPKGPKVRCMNCFKYGHSILGCPLK